MAPTATVPGATITSFVAADVPPCAHQATEQSSRQRRRWARTMTSGSVYIMFNPSCPGMVKIGRTTGRAQDRAKRLSAATGVPTPFVVVYEEPVGDAHAVERSLHKRLEAYRVNRRREFFRVSISDAVRALQLEARRPDSIQEHEILPLLFSTHGKHSIRDFISVKIVIRPWACYLETTRRKYRELADEIVERLDLSFIASDDDIEEDLFRPADGAIVNAERFLRLDARTLAHCTNLLTDEAGQAAAYEASTSFDEAEAQANLLVR